MSESKLPKYSDDEVRVFHPIFEMVLQKAISQMGLNDELEVVHHWSTRGFSGIIDFAICNKKSKKVLLPIEVKKTVLDLKALGRRQARGYSENLGMFRGSDYYLATNLEHVELFRSTPNRVLTIAQLLDLADSYVGDLKTAQYEEFLLSLQKSITQVLEVVRSNDGSEYASNISGLLHALETSIDDLDSWHQAQAFYAFDYIRGALGIDEDFKEAIQTWESAESFASNPEGMGEHVSKIDFDLIFEKVPQGRFNTSEVAQISAGAFEAGSSAENAEDLAGVVNEIAYSIKGIPGVVETTADLAKLLVGHASLLCDITHQSDLRIFEPGCGSGNLIIALKQHFVELTGKQIFGIEKQELFRDVLALRLGLAFKESLKIGERPNLSIRTLESIQASELEKINLVVMNPPFIRGIDCVEERRVLAELIQQNSNEVSILTGDQLGYECGYLELLVNLVPKGTKIATIFPKNAIIRPDSSILRNYLINNFGLRQIVVYKDKNIFGKVQKSTVILLGEKGAKPDFVEILNYGLDIEQIDIEHYKTLEAFDAYVESVAKRRVIACEELQEASNRGWKEFLSEEESDYQEWLSDLLKCAQFERVDVKHDLIRGNIGNKGASDFLFNPKKSSSDSKLDPPKNWKSIRKEWILPAVKNSDSVQREITAHSGESAINVPISELDSKSKDSLYEAYLSGQSDSKGMGAKTGSQRKKGKSKSDIIKLLETSLPTQGPCVLIPRAQRAAAQICFTNESEIMVSTNFFIARCESRIETLILTSWLLTIFGQIQFEHSGIDQEGMRKLEKPQISNCLIPRNLKFSSEELIELEKEVLKTESLKFSSIRIRRIDEIWAKKLSPIDWEVLTLNTKNLLQEMCHNRLGV